jgi:hypothetical protein
MPRKHLFLLDPFRTGSILVDDKVHTIHQLGYPATIRSTSKHISKWWNCDSRCLAQALWEGLQRRILLGSKLFRVVSVLETEVLSFP